MKNTVEIKKRKIGKSGFLVNPIGLGTMPLAIQGRPTEKEALKVIHAALEVGITFIDTADVYCLNNNDIGYCEQLISKALTHYPKKEDVVVATKGGLTRPGGNWVRDSDPKHLAQACEASLKALNVASIDLYQWHAPDPNIPFEESMQALVHLKNSGKIKSLGLSNVNLSEIKKAQKMTEIVSVQNQCNPFNTEDFKNGLIEYCEKEDIAYIPYSPVGGSHQKDIIANNWLLLTIARHYNSNPFQIILAWLLAKSGNITPIPGASHVESAISSGKAMELQLSQEEISVLDHTFISQNFGIIKGTIS